jgi:3-oxoacyl-[acyl-carrier-protein] synthase II
MKRVVVTGIGAVTPVGGTAQSSFNALLNSESGISNFESDKLHCKAFGFLHKEFIPENHQTTFGNSLYHSLIDCVVDEAL